MRWGAREGRTRVARLHLGGEHVAPQERRRVLPRLLQRIADQEVNEGHDLPRLLVQPSEDGGERGLLVQWDAAAEKGWHPVESGGSKGKPAKGGGRREERRAYSKCSQRTRTTAA